MKFLVIFTLFLSTTASINAAGWDTNLQLINLIREGKYFDVLKNLTQISDALLNLNNIKIPHDIFPFNGPTTPAEQPEIIPADPETTPAGQPEIIPADPETTPAGQPECVQEPGIIRQVCGIFRGAESRFSTKEFAQKYFPELFDGENSNGNEDEEQIDSATCFFHSLVFLSHLCNEKLWAFYMFDSWAKVQSGFASGNFRNPGHFSQCLKFPRTEVNEELTIHGARYCNLAIGKYREGSLQRSDLPDFLQEDFPEEPLVDIGALIPDELSSLFVDFAICVPRSCSNQAVLTTTKMITFLIGLGPAAHTENIDLWCSTNQTPPLGAFQWGAIGLIIAGFVGVILATIYELICLRLKITPSESTAAMSAYSNAKYLFTMRQKKDHIQCLYGLRALALLWLMLGYRFIIPLAVPLINTLDIATEFLDSYFAPWIFSSQFGVDALLFLNATLIAYLFMCKMQKSGHVKIWKWYIYRLFRVTPFIGIFIFFTMALSAYQSSGPYYKFLTESQIPACEKYWWSAMFHLQNYVNPNELCILHTYFFSIDMQLFWVAPLLLFPLFFFGAFFLIFIFIIFCLAIACAATVAYYYEFNAFIINNLVSIDKFWEYLRMIVFATHTRMGPWMIGVICGYIIFRLKDGDRKINWFLSAFFWILSISGIIAVVYWIYPYHQYELPALENGTSRLSNVMYIGFARNIFALCLCWFVIGSYTGTGGALSWFLKLSIWQPLAKMSISIYIVSLSAQMVMVASWKTPYVWGTSEMFEAFWGDVMIVFLFSCMTYLTLERPTMRTVKFILRMGQKKDEDDEKTSLDGHNYERTSPWKSFY